MLSYPSRQVTILLSNLPAYRTGVSPLLRGVEVSGSIARTHSVLMRVKSRTVRSIKASHDLSKKTFNLRSKGGETLLLD